MVSTKERDGVTRGRKKTVVDTRKTAYATKGKGTERRGGTTSKRKGNRKIGGAAEGGREDLASRTENTGKASSVKLHRTAWIRSIRNILGGRN